MGYRSTSFACLNKIAHGFKLHPPKVIFNFVQIKTKNAPENQSMIFKAHVYFEALCLNLNFAVKARLRSA